MPAAIMARPLQPCLANPIPTSSSQTVITYKHTSFDEDASDLEHYPYHIGLSNHGQGKTFTIHFVEFRCVGSPPSDIGYPGDVWIDLTSDQFGLYAKVGADWRKWPGLLIDSDSLIAHPHIPTRTLWCTKHRVTWLKHTSLLADWAAHRAEFETALETLSNSNVIGRMLMNEARHAPRKQSDVSNPAALGLKVHVPPNASETNVSSHLAASTSSISRTRHQLPPPNSSQSRSFGRPSDSIAPQHLLDQISDLKDGNRRLSEEVARLREKNTPRRSNGPFRDQVLAAVGEAAFSEELLDIAKDAAISQLMVRVTELTQELYTARVSHLEAINKLSETLNSAEVSRLELRHCLAEFQLVVDSQNHISGLNTQGDRVLSDIPRRSDPAMPATPLFAQTSDTSINTSTQSPDDTAHPSSAAIDLPNSPSRSKIISPSTTTTLECTEPLPSSKLRTRIFSTGSDSTAVIELSKESQSTDIDHSDSNESGVHSEEANSNDSDMVTDLASPPGLQLSTIPNDPIEGVGTIHDPTILASRKRERPEDEPAEASHRPKIFRRSGNEKFREGSLDSTLSNADVEKGYPAETSTLVGVSLGGSNAVEDELTELRILAGTQSSKCLLRKENDKHHLRPDHLDKLYTLDSDRYFCHACFIRSEKVENSSDRVPPVSFPKTVSPHVLIDHFEKVHPDTCKKFIDLWAKVKG